MAIRTLWIKLLVKLHNFVDCAVQSAGPSYVILAVCLISSIIYLFFTAILPFIHDISSVQGLAHVVIACWLIVNVFFNYAQCIFTDPGTPPDYLDPFIHETAMPRWCKHCHKHKPPFTHHCHICKRCTLKMDHHCPWMHNCVGFYNYRFFFVFVFYLWIGCGYAMFMASQLLFGEASSKENNQALFTFLLSFVIFGSLTSLLGWHVFLVSTAQTTIEFYANRQKRKEAKSKGEVWVNEYHVGMLKNLRNVFECDKGGWYWWWLGLLLPTKAPPSGDGLHFPTIATRHLSQQESTMTMGASTVRVGFLEALFFY